MLLISLSLLLIAQALPALASGPGTLVLLQNVDDKDKYSAFFAALTAKGLDLKIKGYRDAELKLRDYDTWLYDNLVLFAPKAEGFGGSLDVQKILEFVDSGRNVLMGLSSDVSEAMRTLAAEVGVEVDERGTRVYDHFHNTGDASTITTGQVVNAPVILGPARVKPVVFSGVAHAVAKEAELVTVVLSAEDTAYSHDPRKPMLEPPALMAGKAAALVSVVQARNNARVMVAGSVDMFTDAHITSDAVGNKQVCVETTAWTFQRAGVIRAENMRHHLVGSSEQPGHYRINDEVEFQLDIFEHGPSGKLPYKADDIQLEFVMLDPYVRLPLKHNGEGTYSLQFKVPDVYGVFKYVIHYKHLGFSYIDLEQVVPVRPFKHDEYDRFLPAAYPYYASALSTMAAFFVLGLFFLYHK